MPTKHSTNQAFTSIHETAFDWRPSAWLEAQTHLSKASQAVVYDFWLGCLGKLRYTPEAGGCLKGAQAHNWINVRGVGQNRAEHGRAGIKL
jgi:hypothetical protein